MHADTFDSLSRLLGAAPSRRGLVKTLVASVTAGVSGSLIARSAQAQVTCPAGTTLCAAAQAPFGPPACCTPSQTCTHYTAMGNVQFGQCTTSCGGQPCDTASSTCVSNTCCRHDLVCGNYCCDPAHGVCPPGQAPCTLGPFHQVCCPTGTTCHPATQSAVGACCPSDSVLCGGICCPTANCLGGTCCSPDRQCAGTCCPEGQTCNNGVCCPSGETGCQGACCADGQVCNGGRCCVETDGCGCCPPDAHNCLPGLIGGGCVTDAEFNACVACTVAWAACQAAARGSGVPATSYICDQSYSACLSGLSGNIDPDLAQQFCYHF